MAQRTSEAQSPDTRASTSVRYPSSRQLIGDYTSRPDLDYPLPTPPPPVDNYDIPSLRQKPLREAAGSPPSKHARSFSNPFPSLFGPRRSLRDRERQNGVDTGAQDSDSTGDDRTRSPNEPPKTPPRQGGRDPQPVTGKCMTCDSTVRWPQGLKVYRCTTCLTINDLEPAVDPQAATSASAPSTSQTPGRKRR